MGPRLAGASGKAQAWSKPQSAREHSGGALMEGLEDVAWSIEIGQFFHGDSGDNRDNQLWQNHDWVCVL